MTASTLAHAVGVDEYLRSSYAQDCEHIDGRLQERNSGEYDHATIQTYLATWFVRHDGEWNTRTRVEQRVQVSEPRFRVPDVCVLRRDKPIEQIVRQAPLMCIEVLSPDDSVHAMRERIADYHKMGVEHVWILDPAAREALICTPTGWNRPIEGRLVVPGTEIFVPLTEIFAGLDE